jgi:hypothetical protein
VINRVGCKTRGRITELVTTRTTTFVSTASMVFAYSMGDGVLHVVQGFGWASIPGATHDFIEGRRRKGLAGPQDNALRQRFDFEFSAC